MVTLDRTAELSQNYLDVEEATREARSPHWRAIFAGVFVSMLIYFTLMSLGLAIGAGEVKDVINGASASGLGTGAGIWLVVTVLISLFVGSYASSRVSGLIMTRVGYVQGAVIAALFFGLMITQAGMLIGAASSGVGALSGAVREVAGGAASQILNNPKLSAIVDDALGDLKFKSSPEVVTTGVLSRALRGDTNSAINYLASQAGITREQAQARFDSLNVQVRDTAIQIGQTSADATRAFGWAAFAMMFLGSLIAMAGGGLGAQMNIRRPVDNMDRIAARRLSQRSRPAYT